MSEEVVVRRERDGLFEIAAVVVGSATRIALTVVSAPLILLPRDARRRVRRAMAELARAVVALPKEIANIGVRVVDEVFDGNATAGSGDWAPEKVAERARGFADRLVRAADEFTSGVGRAADRAANSAEKAAAKVDEWVEKA